MNNFKSRDRNFGPPRMMHKATCSECGNPCEIPFVPTGNRPIYCSNCFESKRPAGSPMRSEQRNFRPQFNAPASDHKVVEQLASLNSKLDRLLSIFEPKEPTLSPKPPTPPTPPKTPKKKVVKEKP